MQRVCLFREASGTSTAAAPPARRESPTPSPTSDSVKENGFRRPFGGLFKSLLFCFVCFGSFLFFELLYSSFRDFFSDIFVLLYFHLCTFSFFFFSLRLCTCYFLFSLFLLSPLSSSFGHWVFVLSRRRSFLPKVFFFTHLLRNSRWIPYFEEIKKIQMKKKKINLEPHFLFLLFLRNRQF